MLAMTTQNKSKESGMTDKSIDQEISGNNIRNAGNDYTENTVNNYFDHHTWKQQSPMAVLNQVAIGNETYFIERFGFDASEEQRRQVLAIKEHFDLTDTNIRVLKRSGALTVVKGQPVKLYSDWIGFAACMILLVLCALVVFLFSSLMFIGGNNLLLEISISAVLIAIYVYFFKDMHRLAIQPAKILRENGIKFGETYIHSAD